MKPENLQFLKDNERHWITLRDAEYMTGLNAGERDGMVRVMQEEFQPGYTTDLWCPPCCADMVKLLYRYYDEWLAKNSEPVAEVAPEKPQQQELPLQTVENVAASFPVNEAPKQNPLKKGRR